MKEIIILFLLIFASISYAYTPPKGIPNPSASFGSFGEIDQTRPDTNSVCSNWISGGGVHSIENGDARDCYYVDNTFVGAASCTGNGAPAKCCTGVGVGATCSANTNDSNTYGSPNKPRASLPTDETIFSAGSITYIHKGAYTLPVSYAGSGTDTSPIWVMGNATTHPTMAATMTLGGSIGALKYFVLDSLDFIKGNTTSKINVCPESANSDHIIIRNLKITGGGKGIDIPDIGDTNDASGIEIGDSEHGYTFDYIVIYNVEISYRGFVNGSVPTKTWTVGQNYTKGEVVKVSTMSNNTYICMQSNTAEAGNAPVYETFTTYWAPAHGQDDCGVYKGRDTDYVWILDSLIHHVNADSVAGSHGATADHPSQHYFIGRNTLYGNGENGIDIKANRYVVISENVIYGPFERETGAAIVLHEGAASIGCKDVWVLFNKIYRSAAGITAYTDEERIYAIGNLIYDIDYTYGIDPEVYYNGAINITAREGAYIIDNTLYDYDIGIRSLIESPDANDYIVIQGNILSSRKSGASNYDLRIAMSTAYLQTYATIDRNLIYLSGSAGTYYVNGASRTLAQLQAYDCNGAKCCSNCPNEADPLFMDASAKDFRLQVGSPAIGVNVEHAAYDTFYTAYSLNIEKDRLGITRPQGLWDIGAYEYYGGYSKQTVGSGSAAQWGVGAGHVFY